MIINIINLECTEEQQEQLANMIRWAVSHTLKTDRVILSYQDLLIKAPILDNQ